MGGLFAVVLSRELLWGNPGGHVGAHYSVRGASISALARLLAVFRTRSFPPFNFRLALAGRLHSDRAQNLTEVCILAEVGACL